MLLLNIYRATNLIHPTLRLCRHSPCRSDVRICPRSPCGVERGRRNRRPDSHPDVEPTKPVHVICVAPRVAFPLMSLHPRVRVCVFSFSLRCQSIGTPSPMCSAIAAMRSLSVMVLSPLLPPVVPEAGRRFRRSGAGCGRRTAPPAPPCLAKTGLSARFERTMLFW